MGGWSWDDEPPSPDAKRLFGNARRLYDRITAVVESGTLLITPEFVCEMHRLATDGEPDAAKPPGQLRVADVQIGSAVILFAPPPWRDVPQLLADTCAAIEIKRASGTVLHAAAYTLWRLNWIHPFGDGNGKTARAVMYAVLCAGFGRMLPGSPALPELIARNKFPYWDALQAADRACAGGEGDVTEMESVLSDLVDEVLSRGR